MDIAILTAFITPFLPFLLKLGGTATEAATESAASKFGEAAWQKAQTVLERIETKSSGEGIGKRGGNGCGQ